MPKISVVMPVYNGEKYLRKAVQSILDQTEKDFELLIIDDGSTDASASIIKSFSDPRIKLMNVRHAGLIAALNKGIGAASGKYIARMDADDIAFPERFQTQTSFLDGNPDVGIIGSWAEIIDEHDQKVGTMIYPPIEDAEIRRYGKLHNPFIHSSVMIRADILKKAGGYRSFFRHVEDYELWTRILRSSHGANIPMPLLRYRYHAGQVTKQRNIEMRIRGLVVRILGTMRL